MAADARPSFGPRGRSRAWADGLHEDCAHVSLGMRRPMLPHRLESTVCLCRCTCHAMCPLADRMPVSLTVWQQLCKCEGGEPYRTWKEDPDEPSPGFKEYREESQRESRERSEARRQARQAARDAVAGKNRDEMRDAYIAELRARPRAGCRGRGRGRPGERRWPAPAPGRNVDCQMGREIPVRGARRLLPSRRGRGTPDGRRLLCEAYSGSRVRPGAGGGQTTHRF
jgi:hypothetical protein